MTRIWTATALALSMFACGGPEPAPAPVEKAAAKPEPPQDESRRFVREGRVSMELVEDDLLGKDYLPGGNLASYERDGKTYQQFLIAAKDSGAAASLLGDVKDQLTDSKFVAHFGGYYGLDGETPWFLFAKDKYVAGIVGLPEAEADLVARDFAARIY